MTEQSTKNDVSRYWFEKARTALESACDDLAAGRLADRLEAIADLPNT